MSGRWSSTWRSAASPSPASATTRQPGTDSSSMRMPARTSRVIVGEHEPQLRRAVDGGGHRSGTASAATGRSAASGCVRRRGTTIERARRIADQPAAHAAEQHGSTGSVAARAGDQEVQVAASLGQLSRGVAGEQDGAGGDRGGSAASAASSRRARGGLDVRAHAVVAGAAHERRRGVAARVEHRDHLELSPGRRREADARAERGVRLVASRRTRRRCGARGRGRSAR